jgi:hypothetical protein
VIAENLHVQRPIRSKGWLPSTKASTTVLTAL